MSELDDPVVVFTGTAWQAEQLQGLLHQAGLESFLRDEVMGRIDAPALAAGAIGAVKLVVRREDRERAGEIVRDFGGERGAAAQEAASPTVIPPPPPWLCIHCGEQVEEQFDVCWNCGAARGE